MVEAVRLRTFVLVAVVGCAGLARTTPARAQDGELDVDVSPSPSPSAAPVDLPSPSPVAVVAKAPRKIITPLTALLQRLPPNGKGDVTKLQQLPPDKLPTRGKVKECCGYPIGLKEDFRLSFYWLAYESEYATLPYDTDIYSKQGFFIGRFPSAFVFELKLEGSGILADGRILNYDGECSYGMGTCFQDAGHG